MAAETNLTGTYTQILGGASETFFIDLGITSINVIKSFYFSTTAGDNITDMTVHLSPDGIALQDVIYSAINPIPADTGINIVPVVSSFIVKPPLRYVAVTVQLPTTGQLLNWAVTYITFASTNAPLLSKFGYEYESYTNQTIWGLLEAPADVSTIIQSVRVSRTGNDGNPDANIRLGINGVPLTEPVALVQPSTVVFSEPIYLKPSQFLNITQDAGVADTIYVVTSYITNT
jgi:hypothetical protein